MELHHLTRLENSPTYFGTAPYLTWPGLPGRTPALDEPDRAGLYSDVRHSQRPSRRIEFRSTMIDSHARPFVI
jgi:hypothetical protein